MKKYLIKLLIITHFELGSFDNNFIGEAQLFYNNYFKDGSCFSLNNGKFAYLNKDENIILIVSGSGKVNTTSTLVSLLQDNRFDYSNAYILNTGCCGGSFEFTNYCDEIIESEVFDQDLGHTCDRFDLSNINDKTWYHDKSYDDTSYIKLNENLYNKVYDLVKTVNLNISNKLNIMPKIKIGCAASGDNFWKGEFSHQRVVEISKYYKTLYPYAITEMEDIAVAVVCKQFKFLDKLISIRACVNLDIFKNNECPEILWENEYNYNEMVKNENKETIDCFEIAMKNNYVVCGRIIDLIITNKF